MGALEQLAMTMQNNTAQILDMLLGLRIRSSTSREVLHGKEDPKHLKISIVRSGIRSGNACHFF